MSRDCEHAHEDGAYVLGALSSEDRLAFERHLPDCSDCARSVRELAGLPGLLAHVPIEILDPDQVPASVPDTLLPSLVRQVRRTERRRTWLTAGLVGVAAAVTVGVVAFVTLGGDDDGPPSANTSQSPSAAPSTEPPLVMRPVGDAPVSGSLSLTPVGWGTRLDLTCSYPSGSSPRSQDSQDYGDPSGSTYTMRIHTRGGSVEQVASWKALPGRTMHLSAATAADRAVITSVEVRTSSGQLVLELDA